jgi:AraC-like DNA-binding protein
MQNVYNDIMGDMSYNKFVIGDLLFVEYTCPITEDIWSVWTQTDFIIHVLRGKKKLWTGSEEWMILEGDTVYVKKGSFCMSQYFDDEFCMLGFFITDDFIRSVIKDTEGRLPINTRQNLADFSIKRMTNDLVLCGFFNSMLPFFRSGQNSPSLLLELKLKELVVHILSTELNPELSSYFQSLFEIDKPSIRSIMEKNFYHNLSIAEFATLSHRSLSTFKRDFLICYSLSPGKWLLNKRLEYSLALLQNKANGITEVAFKSGFENPSHYSRSFRSKFGMSPSQYRSDTFDV